MVKSLASQNHTTLFPYVPVPLSWPSLPHVEPLSPVLKPPSVPAPLEPSPAPVWWQRGLVSPALVHCYTVLPIVYRVKHR